MEIDFYKIHILKNDLILVNHLYTPSPKPETFAKLARIMCRPHTGIGGNGILVLEPGTREKIRLRYILPDGSDSPVVNDALLCAARFAFDSGIFEDMKLRFEVDDESRSLDIIDSGTFRISLGAPMFFESGQEMREEPDFDYNISVEVNNREYVVTPVSLDMNGLVHFSGDLNVRAQKELSGKLKSVLRKGLQFQPVFAQVYSRDELNVRTWFSGKPVDFSSIAGMAAVAAVLNGFADREPLVHLNRQELFIQWNGHSNQVLLTAKPEYVFSGSYYADV